MVRIATWNVNSIKARLPNVLDWLRQANPDIALFQETKCLNEAFPYFEFETLGYNIAHLGQKSYNGVAILSKRPLDDVTRHLPGGDEEEAEQARYIEATIGTLRVASVYLPNGNPVDSPKFDYKLGWMERLKRHLGALLETEQTFVLGGDYNVIPTDDDCHDPAYWSRDALFQPATKRKWHELLNVGVLDAFRALNDEPGHFTFWDYQARAWEANRGIRIDHFLLSPEAADRLEGCVIDKAPRGLPKASDHVPVVLTLEGEA